MNRSYFQLFALKPGIYRVTASAEGYLSACTVFLYIKLTFKFTHHFDVIYNIVISDLNILRNIIIKTAPDSYTITIKQIVRF